MRHSFLFKILVLLIISVCVCPDSLAQIQQPRQKPDQIGGSGHQGPIKPPESSKGNKSKKRTSNKSMRGKKGKESDSKTGRDKPSEGVFVYYADVVKLNGWLVGVGEPLTRDQARQLDTYFKFSQQNAAGHWCFLEAFKKQGYINCDHVIHPYMYLYYGDGDWLDKLDSICKWEFVADSSGVTVAEERWLLADSSAVLNFHPIQISDREILGLYTDKSGDPICTYDDEVYEVTDIVRFVHVIRDEYGFDVTIDEFDADSILEKYKEPANELLKRFKSHDP